MQIFVKSVSLKMPILLCIKFLNSLAWNFQYCTFIVLSTRFIPEIRIFTREGKVRQPSPKVLSSLAMNTKFDRALADDYAIST